MAVMRCPECGGQVSSLAGACPHCGAPSRHIANDQLGTADSDGGWPWLKIFLVLVVLGLGGAYLYHTHLKTYLAQWQANHRPAPRAAGVPPPAPPPTTAPAPGTAPAPATAPTSAPPPTNPVPPAATTTAPAVPAVSPVPAVIEPARPVPDPLKSAPEPAKPASEASKPTLPAETPAVQAQPPETPLDAKTKERLARFRERTAETGLVRDCRYHDGGLLTIYVAEDKWLASDCDKREKAARALRDQWLETGGKKIEVRGRNDELLAAETAKPAAFAYPLGGPVQFTIKGCEAPPPPSTGGK